MRDDVKKTRSGYLYADRFRDLDYYINNDCVDQILCMVNNLYPNCIKQVHLFSSIYPMSGDITINFVQILRNVIVIITINVVVCLAHGLCLKFQSTDDNLNLFTLFFNKSLMNNRLL